MKPDYTVRLEVDVDKFYKTVGEEKNILKSLTRKTREANLFRALENKYIY